MFVTVTLSWFPPITQRQCTQAVSQWDAQARLCTMVREGFHDLEVLRGLGLPPGVGVPVTHLPEPVHVLGGSDLVHRTRPRGLPA